MDTKDLRTEPAVEDRNNDVKTSYLRSANTFSYVERNKPYQESSSASLSKVEVQTTRPCAVIGPDRIITRPSYASNSPTVKSHEFWNTEHGPPDYTYRMGEYQDPTRNISPRLTYQENMLRVMVPNRYPEASKPIEDLNHSMDKSNQSLQMHVKPQVPGENKLCDVPYNQSPNLSEHRVDTSAPSVNSSTLRSAPHGWPGSVNERPTISYSGSEIYQYPEFPSNTVPRALPLVRTHRSRHDEPVPMYGDPFYRPPNIRYEPYSMSKERYPQPRYEYVNYPNSYHPTANYPPPKYDLPKFQHQYGYSQIPFKVRDPQVDYYKHSYPHKSQNLPYQNHELHSNYAQLPGTCLQNKYAHPAEGNINTSGVPKSSYDFNNKQFVPPKPYPENYYLNELQRQQMKGPIINRNYMHGTPPYPFYRRDNMPYKHNEMSSIQIKNPDHMFNNHMHRMPFNFSPNVINSGDYGLSQEDCGYVSQSSTNSVQSSDSAYTMYRAYDNKYSYANRNHPFFKETASSVIPGNKQKRDIDVRQFLQMWNEGEEETNECGGSKEINVEQSSKNFMNTQNQLYVLGLVNVPSEELGKYEHIQKISKLPENIKGYTNLELLSQFEQAIGSSNISQSEPKSFGHNKTPKESQNPITIPLDPLSPLDVEEKISQSVIHKEVGCNFEIKPCSPQMFMVEVTPATSLIDERSIEKVHNPLKPQSPVSSCKKESVQGTQNTITTLKGPSVEKHSSSSITISCEMQKANCSPRHNIDTLKPNYSYQDLESNAGICLASLPRIDSDIELSFAEVNQQFINANKPDTAMSTNSNNNIPDDNTDCNNLLRNTNEANNDSFQDNQCKNKSFQSVRTNSVIIKNPENINDKFVSDSKIVDNSSCTNELIDIMTTTPINLAITTKSKSEKNYEHTSKEPHKEYPFTKSNFSIDEAINLSLNPIDPLYEEEFDSSNKSRKHEWGNTVFHENVNDCQLNILNSCNDVNSTQCNNNSKSQVKHNISLHECSTGHNDILKTDIILEKDDSVNQPIKNINVSSKIQNIKVDTCEIMNESNAMHNILQDIKSNYLSSKAENQKFSNECLPKQDIQVTCIGDNKSPMQSEHNSKDLNHNCDSIVHPLAGEGKVNRCDPTKHSIIETVDDCDLFKQHTKIEADEENNYGFNNHGTIESNSNDSVNSNTIKAEKQNNSDPVNYRTIEAERNNKCAVLNHPRNKSTIEVERKDNCDFLNHAAIKADKKSDRGFENHSMFEANTENNNDFIYYDINAAEKEHNSDADEHNINREENGNDGVPIKNSTIEVTGKDHSDFINQTVEAEKESDCDLENHILIERNTENKCHFIDQNIFQAEKENSSDPTNHSIIKMETENDFDSIEHRTVVIKERNTGFASMHETKLGAERENNCKDINHSIVEAKKVNNSDFIEHSTMEAGRGNNCGFENHSTVETNTTNNSHPFNHSMIEAERENNCDDVKQSIIIAEKVCDSDSIAHTIVNAYEESYCDSDNHSKIETNTDNSSDSVDRNKIEAEKENKRDPDGYSMIAAARKTKFKDVNHAVTEVERVQNHNQNFLNHNTIEAQKESEDDFVNHCITRVKNGNNCDSDNLTMNEMEREYDAVKHNSIIEIERSHTDNNKTIPQYENISTVSQDDCEINMISEKFMLITEIEENCVSSKDNQTIYTTHSEGSFIMENKLVCTEKETGDIRKVLIDSGQSLEKDEYVNISSQYCNKETKKKEISVHSYNFLRTHHIKSGLEISKKKNFFCKKSFSPLFQNLLLSEHNEKVKNHNIALKEIPDNNHPHILKLNKIEDKQFFNKYESLSNSSKIDLDSSSSELRSDCSKEINHIKENANKPNYDSLPDSLKQDVNQIIQIKSATTVSQPQLINNSSLTNNIQKHVIETNVKLTDQVPSIEYKHSQDHKNSNEKKLAKSKLLEEISDDSFINKNHIDTIECAAVKTDDADLIDVNPYFDSDIEHLAEQEIAFPKAGVSRFEFTVKNEQNQLKKQQNKKCNKSKRSDELTEGNSTFNSGQKEEETNYEISINDTEELGTSVLNEKEISNHTFDYENFKHESTSESADEKNLIKTINHELLHQDKSYGSEKVDSTHKNTSKDLFSEKDEIKTTDSQINQDNEDSKRNTSFVKSLDGFDQEENSKSIKTDMHNVAETSKNKIIQTPDSVKDMKNAKVFWPMIVNYSDSDDESYSSDVLESKENLLQNPPTSFGNYSRSRIENVKVYNYESHQLHCSETQEEPNLILNNDSQGLYPQCNLESTEKHHDVESTLNHDIKTMSTGKFDDDVNILNVQATPYSKRISNISKSEKKESNESVLVKSKDEEILCSSSIPDKNLHESYTQCTSTDYNESEIIETNDVNCIDTSETVCIPFSSNVGMEKIDECSSPDNKKQAIKNTSVRRTLKRSLSDSVIYNSTDVLDNIYSKNNSPLWPHKRKKIIFEDTNTEKSENYASLEFGTRRNSLSPSAETVSFCILIDNDYIISQDSQDVSETICLTDLHENNIDTNSIICEDIDADPHDMEDPHLHFSSDTNDQTGITDWVDDIACIETVVTDNNINNSDNTVECCNDDDISNSSYISQGEYNEVVANDYYYPREYSPVNNIELIQESSPVLVIHDVIPSNISNSETNIYQDHIASDDDDECFQISITRANSKRQSLNSGDKINSWDTNADIDSKCFSSSSPPEVSSTTLEDKRSNILLKITNLNGSRTSQTTFEYPDRKIRCKFTEKCDYLTTGSSFNRPKPLITKAAQKYIPPMTIPDLRVSLPLPNHILEKLRLLKLRPATFQDKKIHFKASTQRIPLPVKKSKPNFEDVLMNIDKANVELQKDKLKKIKRNIPKVIIKKTGDGSHYTSPPDKSFNPDLTGRKWQPWVIIERNSFIDKMSIKGKTKAVYCHRKRTYILFEKKYKYKSVGFANANFVMSQYKSDHFKYKNPLKYTFRLKS